ncbi:hypothetical protein [Streptococcus mitis]|uniref:hypothetical protein n=1 Tax=Streptococcus mitis TaxID=28037 RepID=UPI0022B7A0F4|nr:hypothetical protein [Streptococcus mitis]
MRHKFQQVLDKIHDFLNGHEEPDQIDSNSLTTTIEEAIQKQTAVHLILSETSFTGDIIKYDQQRQQIIVKNFDKNVTRIIRISDIQRLRFVPSTVQTAQKNRFKKE